MFVLAICEISIIYGRIVVPLLGDRIIVGTEEKSERERLTVFNMGSLCFSRRARIFQTGQTIWVITELELRSPVWMPSYSKRACGNLHWPDITFARPRILCGWSPTIQVGTGKLNLGQASIEIEQAEGDCPGCREEREECQLLQAHRPVLSKPHLG